MGLGLSVYCRPAAFMSLPFHTSTLRTCEAQIFDILTRHMSSTGQQYFSNWWGLISATFAQLSMEPYRQTFVCSAAYYKASLDMHQVKFLWRNWSCSESWGVISVPPSPPTLFISLNIIFWACQKMNLCLLLQSTISKFLFSSPPHFISGSQKKIPFQLLAFFLFRKDVWRSVMNPGWLTLDFMRLNLDAPFSHRHCCGIWALETCNTEVLPWRFFLFCFFF